MGIIEEILDKVNAQSILIQQIIDILHTLPNAGDLEKLDAVATTLDASTAKLQEALESYSN